MAKDKTLELSIQIAGKVDKSLMSALGKAEKSVSSFSRNMSKIGTAGLAAMGALSAGAVAAIADCTNAAKDFESQMGDVVKYVNGLADATGKISDTIDKETGRTFAENYGMMKDAILDLSTQIPMTAEELTRLAAAAGQSGKGINDLIQYDSNGNISGFLKDVAMMGTAMDISAEQAGDWAAKWEKAFSMNHDEVMVLSDQINYLGANSATTAAEIAQAVNDAASLGQIAGADVSTTAALADAMLATGVGSDRVATSLKRIYTNISKGESATKAQKETFAELGMTATGVAKAMQQDASGTMLQIFDAIGNLPEERQVAALSNLFGQWAIEGAAKITGNLETYTDALRMVNDPSLYTGSMEREFIIKASTSESIDQMMANSWQALKIDFGTEFLPVKKEFSLLMIDVMNGIRKNMPELKELGKSLAEIAKDGIDKLGSALQTALPYIQKGLDFLANNGDKAATVLGGLAATFAGMKAAPLIESLFGGGGNLLFGKTGAFGKKSGGLFSLFGKGQQAGSLLMSGAQKGIAAGASGTTAGSAAAGILGTLQNWGGLTSGSKNMRNKASSGLMTMLAGQGANGGFGGMLSGMLGNSKAAGALSGTKNWLGGIGAAAKAVPGAFGTAGANLQLGAILGQGLGGMQGAGMMGSGIVSAFTGVFGSLSGVMSAALGPMVGIFGSILSGALPIVGVISTIIAVISILGDHIGALRPIIGNVFGEQGLAVFDTFTEKLKGIKTFILNLFNGGLADAVAPLRDAFVGLFSGDAATMAGKTFDSVVMILQSVLGVVGQVVDFAVTYVKPIIQDIFAFITGTVLPLILSAFNAAAPIISSIITNVGTAIMTVAQIIAEAIRFALPIIETIITVIMSIASVVIPTVLSVFDAGFAAISSILSGVLTIVSPILDGLKTMFGGLIDFITGVFTGNWSAAWEGVKNIFKGAFEALVGLAKAPINAVISLINGAISGLNSISVSIPDWVPGVGGKSFGVNIPTIPMLAKGGFTNGPSIAGEAGTEAVISFDNGVRSQNIDTWMQAGRMLGIDSLDNARELQEIDESGAMGGGNLTFAPNITIQGNADQNVVDNMVEQMRAMFESWYEQRQRMEARTAY